MGFVVDSYALENQKDLTKEVDATLIKEEVVSEKALDGIIKAENISIVSFTNLQVETSSLGNGSS